MLTTLAFIFVFGLVVLVHEMGHFLVAKKVGIRADEFGLGFGKRIFAVKYGETTYSLNLIPLGGFVKLAGMDGEEATDISRSYNGKTVWQKMAVIVSGPLMNFLLAFLLFTLIFTWFGVPVNVSNSTIIGNLLPGYPAEKAGLQPGDKILAVNGEQVSNWEQVVKVVNLNPNKPTLFTVERNNQQFQTKITPKLEKERKVGLIGITPKVISQQLGLWAAIKNGFLQTIGITWAIIVGIKQMIMGQIASDVSGPLGIAQMAGQAAKTGMENLLRLTAVLSINLGLFNLLPIPALDGGRLFFLGIEAVRGKPIEPQKEGMVHFVGFMLLLFLLVVVTYKDITKLFLS